MVQVIITHYLRKYVYTHVCVHEGLWWSEG